MTEAERLNAFFEEQFEQSVARSTQTQTFLGIKTDYDKWDDASDEHAVEDFQLLTEAYETMTSEFDFDALDDSAKLSYRLFEYQYRQAERAFPFRDFSYTFDQMNGEQSGIPAFMINQHRIASLSDAKDYIARLNGIDEHLGQPGVRLPPVFRPKHEVFMEPEVAAHIQGLQVLAMYRVDPLSEGEAHELHERVFLGIQDQEVQGANGAVNWR